MIRIIFDDGSAVNCVHIAKMYIEEFEMEKVTIVGNIKERNILDVQIHDEFTEEKE